LRKYSYVLDFQASAGRGDKKLFSVLNNAVFLEMLILFVFMNPKSDSKYAQRSHPRTRQIINLSKVTCRAATVY